MVECAPFGCSSVAVKVELVKLLVLCVPLNLHEFICPICQMGNTLVN